MDILFSLIKGIVVALALITAALYFLQRSVLYQPGERLTPEQFQNKVAGTFNGAATVIPGFDAIVLEPSAGTPVVATSVWFHGNAGTGGQRDMYAPVFNQRGLRLVLAEYPGYAARDGVPTEQQIVQDGRALLAEVARRFPKEPIILVGESLGSGVATQLAAQPGKGPVAQRIILLTPYMSIAQTAAQSYPMLPWVRFLVKDRFDSASALPLFAGPVSILVAEKDEVIGAKQGRDLAQIALTRPNGKASTFVLEIPGAGHSTWRNGMTPAHWTKMLGAAPLMSPGQ